jgi:ParB family chromosome partitioning protein
MKFSDASLDELARSIRETGVLQPILAVPEGSSYKIITGERRWRAALKAGLKRVPVLIRTLPDEKQLEVSLIENLQREDLNPLEIAHAYQKLIEELSYSQEDIAEKVGKDRTSVANYLRLLKLPDEVRQHLAEGKISMGHARALLALDSSELQTALSRRIIKKNLSVREVEKEIQKSKKPRAAEKRALLDPDLLALQEEFLRILGTKVMISGSQERGVIKIFYFSLDELNRIFEQVKGVRS